MATKTEIERLAVMETKVEGIEKGLEKVDKKVDGLHNKLDTFIECSDKKYAEKKRVELIETRVDKLRLQWAKAVGATGLLVLIIELVLSHFGMR